MQLIKVNEVLIEEEILNEADYGSVFDKEFKSYIVRVGNRKNPSENVRQTGNDGRPVADTICKTFNDAIDIAKNVSSGQGLFKNKNDSSIAFIKFSTKELSDDVQQTAFDSTKSVCLWYRDGKLTSDSKKDLKDLYNDIKQRQKAGVKLQEPEIAHADVQYEKDKAEAEKAEKEAAEKEQKAKEDYAEAIEKLKRFEARLANFCPRT